MASKYKISSSFYFFYKYHSFFFFVSSKTNDFANLFLHISFNFARVKDNLRTVFTRILQYIWAITALLSLGVSIYKLVLIQSITHKVYFPFFISIFCTILFFNLRSQNRFLAKMKSKENSENQ